MSGFLNFLTEYATTVGLKIVYAAILLFVGMKLIKWLTKNVSKLPLLSKLDTSVSHFAASALKVALYALLFAAVAIILGFPATTLVTVLGSAGLAVGLALQGSLTNIAGSLILLITKPYKIGDYIEYGGIAGTVKDINLFYTVITTVDNKVITCPNGALSNSNIVNYSAMDNRRVDLVFSAKYGTNTDDVVKILVMCAQRNELVLRNPATEAFVSELSDSSIKFTLRAWCKSGDYWTVYFGLMDDVKKVFDAAGIEIPFQQMDVHIRND